MLIHAYQPTHPRTHTHGGKPSRAGAAARISRAAADLCFWQLVSRTIYISIARKTTASGNGRRRCCWPQPLANIIHYSLDRKTTTSGPALLQHHAQPRCLRVVQHIRRI